MQKVKALREDEVLSRSLYQECENKRYKEDKGMIELQEHLEKEGRPLTSTVRPVAMPGTLDRIITALGKFACPMSIISHF